MLARELARALAMAPDCHRENPSWSRGQHGVTRVVVPDPYPIDAIAIMEKERAACARNLVRGPTPSRERRASPEHLGFGSLVMLEVNAHERVLVLVLVLVVLAAGPAEVLHFEHELERNWCPALAARGREQHHSLLVARARRKS